MSNTYVQEGKVVQFTLAGAATSGVPIIAGTMIGIPVTDGETGDTINIFIEGVHNLPLKSGGATPAFGDIVSFDTTDGVAIGAGTAGDVNNAGKIMDNDAEETDAFVQVKLTPATGVLAT